MMIEKREAFAAYNVMKIRYIHSVSVGDKSRYIS